MKLIPQSAFLFSALMLSCMAATSLVPLSPAHAAYISTKSDFPEAQIFVVRPNRAGNGTGASDGNAIGLADMQKLIDTAKKPIRFHLLPGTNMLPASLDLRKTAAPLVIFEGVGQRTTVTAPLGAPLFLASTKSKLVLRHFRIAEGATLVTPLSSLVTVSDAKVEPTAKAAAQKGLPVPPTVRTVYVSPDGIGSRQGIAVNNAISLADFLRNELSPKVATRFNFLPGTYPLKSSVTFDKNSTAQIVLEGNGDTTLFTGVFTFPEKNATTPFLNVNRSNIMVRNLAARNVGSLVKVAGASRADNILIDNVTVTDSHQAISINRYGKYASVSNWQINNVRIKGFYEAGMRIAGANTKNIQITKTTIDAKNSSGKNDCWVGGLQILEYASFITLDDVKISNTVGSCAGITSYEQGDGIEADGKQGLPHDLTFRNVTVENARDGAFDLKAENVLLEDIEVIQGPANRFPLRLWTGKNYKCVRCDIPAGAKGHLNSLQSYVEFVDPVQEPATFKFECKVGTSKTATDEGFKVMKNGMLARTAYCKK